jgi:hypothetical protein
LGLAAGLARIAVAGVGVSRIARSIKASDAKSIENNTENISAFSNRIVFQ